MLNEDDVIGHPGILMEVSNAAGRELYLFNECGRLNLSVRVDFQSLV